MKFIKKMIKQQKSVESVLT